MSVFKLRNRKEVFAWSLYDFANQPFTTIIVTFIYSAFFVKVIAENEQELVVGWGVGNSLGLEVFDNINTPVVFAPKPGSGQVLSVDSAFSRSSFLTVGVFELNEDVVAELLV